MDVVLTIVAFVVAVAAAVAAAVFYSRAKVAERDFVALKISQGERMEQQVAKAVASAQASLAESERRVSAAQVENARLREQMARLEAQAQKAREGYEFALREKDREIERIQNDRAKLSVKMLGESLEQHCEIAFNQVRTYAFPNATFGKDNDASQGSKGDYIYREVDESGAELLSIMFEMKNEAEGSTHTKKNADHFKKLDHDRRAKGCEYAVLVSLLEPESDLYNTGIVDVSYEYEKMFVIRPQFFVPFIGLLRNAAMSSLAVKRELERKRREDVDLAGFEDKLESLKGVAAGFYDKTHDKCAAAKKSIGQAITKMESIQHDLDMIDGSSLKAREKTEDLSVRRLTWGNKAMREAFQATRED